MNPGKPLFHNLLRRVTPLFLTAELSFYLAYLILDAITGRSLLLSDAFKYGGIILCFLYTLLLVGTQKAARPDKPRQPLIWLAFAGFFVLFSDFCLLFTTAAAPGIALFCLVQCFYFLYQSKIRRLWQIFLIPAAVSLTGSAALALIYQVHHPLVPLALFYLTMLLINIALAWHKALAAPQPPAFMFAAGLVLYCLCDLNVGFMNARYIISGPMLRALPILANPVFREISTFSMWFFYLPAQVLIALSAAWPLLRRQSEVRSLLRHHC